MEVDLQLVAKIDTLFTDMKKLKDSLVEVDKATNSVGKNLSGAFKTPAQDINNLVSGAKTAKDALTGFDALLANLQNSNGPEELVHNFEELVLEAKKTLPPLEALEFQLKALQALRPFVDDLGTLDAVDARIKNINTDLDKLKAKDIVKPAAGLRAQLTAARNEVGRLADELGPLAPATLAAAKNAGVLQDRMKDVNATLSALNPDAKFQAFAALAQGIAGSFQIATGALALFGTKSEDVERILLKVQGAMAFAQGLNSILELKDAFTNVAAVVKVWLAGLTAVNTATEANAAASTVAAAASEANAVASEQLSIAYTEQAVAGEQLALAMEVETVAVEGAAVAAEGAAVSTGVLATAIEVLTGPVGIIIGSLGILVGLILAFSHEAEEAKVDVDLLVRSMNDLHDQLQFLQDFNRTDIENDTKLLIAKAKENADAILQIELDKNLRIRDLDTDLQKTQLQNIATLRDQIKEINDERLKGGKKLFDRLTAEEEESLSDKEKLRKKDFDKLSEQLKAESSIYDRLTQEINQTFIEDELNRIEHDKKVEELRQKFLKQLKEDADKLLKLQVEREAALALLFNGQTRIDLERSATEKAIEAKRQGVIDEVTAEIEQAKISYGEGSKEIAAIRANGRKRIEQADENAQIEGLAAAKKFTEDSLKNLVDNELLKNQFLTNLQEKALADFLANFQLRQRAILESDLSIADQQKLIEEEKAKGILEINNKFSQDYLDQQKEFESEKLDSLDKTGLREIDFEKEVQIKKLELNIKYDELQIQRARAQAAALLAIAPDADTSAIDLAIAKLETDILKSRAAIQEINDRVEPVSLADILGLKLSKTQEAEFNAAAESIFKSAVSIYSKLLDIRKQEVERQIELDNQLIVSLNKRVDETERQLDREIKLRELGFASNIAATEKQLEDEKKMRDKALAEKEKLVKQERALAKQQALIQAAQSASTLVTAAATLFGKEVAKGGVVGVFTAIAAIATMLAAFLSFKSSLQASAQSYGEGGWIKGKSHSSGGVDINAEHDEFMMRRYVATKHPRAMEAINDQDWQNVPDSFLIPILKARGIRLSSASADKIMNDHVRVAAAESSAPARLDKLEKLTGETNEHLKQIREKLNDREERTLLPDGSTKIVKGNKTIIIRT